MTRSVPRPSRRQFLRYLGAGSLALLLDPPSLRMPSLAETLITAGEGLPFAPIGPSTIDDLVRAAGYDYRVLASFEDPILTREGMRVFGDNADFTAFLPRLNAQPGEGWLWVNHEYANLSELPAPLGAKSAERLRREREAVGGSLLAVRLGPEGPELQPQVPGMRLDGFATPIGFDGPAADLMGGPAEGTSGNCSGGLTPWGTILTCEEKHQSLPYWGWPVTREHYGWVVEVDPEGRVPPIKHTALGRFAHENAALRVRPDGRIEAYMGDDDNGEHFYRFVSRDVFDLAAPIAEQQQLLVHGELAAAQFHDDGQGRWLVLDWATEPTLREKFADQGEVLLHCREAAKLLGSTGLDRPEDCEIHPYTGALYLALTNDGPRERPYGQILRITDAGDGASFVWEQFLVGSADGLLACPDNLCFDAQARLWVATDYGAGRDPYKPLGNNGLFCIPTEGPEAGRPLQFASGPIGSELTGPCFADEGRVLFLSVQHPEGTWNPGPDGLARSAVVAVGRA